MNDNGWTVLLLAIQLIATGVGAIVGTVFGWLLKRQINQFDEWRKKTEERVEFLMRQSAGDVARRDAEVRMAAVIEERWRTIEIAIRELQRELGTFVKRGECAVIHQRSAGD